MKPESVRSLAAAALLFVAGCSSAPHRDFIPKSELPDPLLYLPPPPAADSATKAWDLAQHALATKLRADPARAAQAARDAVFTWENLFETFAPAYGRTISEAETPALCAMLKFGLNTTRNAYRGLKRTYRRERPFAELNEPPLRPEDAKHLGPDSYPSGHAATAWAAALLLSEVRPAAAEAVLDRGLVAGESRLVCGVHWASDVATGRLVAGVAVSRLHVDPDFRQLLDAALREEAALPPPPAPPADPFAAGLPDAVAPGDTITLPFFGAVTVVDAAEAAAATPGDHRFEDFPAGASVATNLLGRGCRALAAQETGRSVLQWRLGEGKGVKPNGAYVVLVEYPDDRPRDYLVRNNANHSRDSFHTGAASPQSGEWRLWTAFASPGAKAPTRTGDGTTDVATEGFDFLLEQGPKANHPASAGLAVGRVLLCEIPDETAPWAPVVYPPAPLPRRRIRPSDGATDSLCAGRACMMAEIDAMANGDPVDIGHPMGPNFTRGFPGPAQEFNRNFLALPALPSERLVYACTDADVVLRRIDAGESGDYYALVHSGRTAKANVRVRFPEGVRRLVAPATGEAFAPGPDGVFTFALQPWQLLALRAE